MKFFTALMLMIFTHQLIQAQITETTSIMSQGENNALVVTLPDTDEKIVTKEWESYIKGFKAKIRNIKKSTEIFADDAKIEDMSNNTVDVYAVVSQRGDDTELKVWYDLGGTYLTSETHPKKYNTAQKMLNDFSGIVSKTYIANMLQEEEKKLKGLEGDLKDIENSKENAEKDIEKFEKKIEEAKATIEESISKKEAALKDIEAQKMVVKQVKSKLNN